MLWKLLLTSQYILHIKSDGRNFYLDTQLTITHLMTIKKNLKTGTVGVDSFAVCESAIARHFPAKILYCEEA